MQLKKLLVFTAVMLSITSFAFGAGQIFMKTTVPNIPKSATQADCDQAGTITLEFNNSSEMHLGDAVQFTLNNGVVLCKEVHMYLKMMDNTVELLTSDTNLPLNDSAASDTDYLVLKTSGVEAVAPGAALVLDANGDGTVTESVDIGFRIHGGVGSQVITATLGIRVKATGQFFAAASLPNSIIFKSVQPETKMVVKLFDKKTQLLFKDRVTTTATSNPPVNYADYLDAISAEDNVLCINTFALPDIMGENQYVKATPDSLPITQEYKLSFSGDYVVAHLMPQEAYTIAAACKDTCPTVRFGYDVDQYGNPIAQVSTFDPGTYVSGVCTNDRWVSENTCASLKGNGVRLAKTGSYLPLNTDFRIEMNMLLNGTPVQSALTWAAADQVRVFLATTASGGCDCASVALTEATGLTWTLDATKTVLRSNIFQITNPNVASMLIEFPMVNFGGTLLKNNDKAEVQVKFTKYPCGTLAVATHCLGVFVDKCSTTVTTNATKLLFPYALAGGELNAEGELWWSGLVLTNTSSTAGEATIKIFDNAGHVETKKVTVPARSNVVNTVEGFLGTTSAVTTNALYIEVECPFDADGILLIGSGYNSPDSLLYGMLPRKY